jgi:hypothetical protein
MRSIIALTLVTVGALVTGTGSALGQEVNSDVSIPIPREVVAAMPEVSGLLAEPVRFPGQDIQDLLGDTDFDEIDEATARAQVGDFMASLLIKAGVITVEPQPIGVSSSHNASNDGSRPAWTGRTPISLSFSRTGRSGAIRRR